VITQKYYGHVTNETSGSHGSQHIEGGLLGYGCVWIWTEE
jgi:hypothetical protein